MKNSLQCQVHRMLTLLLKNKREFIIFSTVIAAMLSHLIIFSFDYTYYTNYTVGMIRSFMIILLCVPAIKLTVSWRIIGLMIFLVLSMAFDLARILSTDWYWILKPVVSKNKYNFNDIYITYEVLCAIFPFIYLASNLLADRLKDFFSNNFSSFNSYFNKSNTICKKKKI